MHRRDFLSLVTALLSGGLAAQALPAKVYRIGWLSTVPPDAPVWEAFVEGLRERGWIEGKNVAFEFFHSEGRNDRFPALAAELVKRNVDIIVAIGTPPAEAARDATTSIPIVFVFVGDPVERGSSTVLHVQVAISLGWVASLPVFIRSSWRS